MTSCSRPPLCTSTEADRLEARAIVARIELLNYRERILINRHFTLYAALVDNRIKRKQIVSIQRGRIEKG